MLTIVGTLVVVALVAYGAYSGAREGAFYGTYVLMRTLIGLMVGFTFLGPLAGFLTDVTGAEYPWPDYIEFISFLVLFVGTTTVIRQFKVRATAPTIPCIGLFDTLYGAATGFANGVLSSGVVLLVISMLPVLPYTSPGIGRYTMAEKPYDTGGVLLSFYNHIADRFGGNTDFPLTAEDTEPLVEDQDLNYNDKFDFPGEAFVDINGNGEWDRGWLVRYRTSWQFGTLQASRAGYPLNPATADSDSTQQ